MAQTVTIPEFCFTPEDAADFNKRGKRCAEKAGPGCRSFTICGYKVELPPFPFSDERKRLNYLPGPVVLQVYTRRGLCIGAFKDLDSAQQLMFKRGRNAGHKMHVCVDYSPPLPYTPITARVCIARIGRQLAQTLYAEKLDASAAAQE